MSKPYRYLRNTISGVTHEFSDKEASDLLKHPTFGKVLVEVDSPKNEVLAAPYEVSPEGDRKSIFIDTPPDQEEDDEFVIEDIPEPKKEGKK